VRILALESSCDETAAAVVEAASRPAGGEGLPETVVLGDRIASQVADHAPYGGVVPELASRVHLRAVLPTARAAMVAAGLTLDDIDALAVTAGPGLVGSLLVGLQVAKAVAHARGLPVVGVHHLHGHLLAAHLRRPGLERPAPAFPYVALVASGGHTALYRVDGPERILRLAGTRDDAAGEAFDKVGKLLGLPYPGGPHVERAARGVDPGDLRFPRGLDRRDTLDFSFSGLKTAVADRLAGLAGLPDAAEVGRIAAAFQQSVIDSLVRKSFSACRRTGLPRLVLGGGVAANGALREAMRAAGDRHGVRVFLPDRAECTDNAAMIGIAAVPRLLRGEDDGGTLGARASWPFGEPKPASPRG
jgi:N6-L-threonylcarbamoyladenine synthase